MDPVWIDVQSSPRMNGTGWRGCDEITTPHTTFKQRTINTTTQQTGQFICSTTWMSNFSSASFSFFLKSLLNLGLLNSVPLSQTFQAAPIQPTGNKLTWLCMVCGQTTTPNVVVTVGHNAANRSMAVISIHPSLLISFQLFNSTGQTSKIHRVPSSPHLSGLTSGISMVLAQVFHKRLTCKRLWPSNSKSQPHRSSPTTLVAHASWRISKPPMVPLTVSPAVTVSLPSTVPVTVVSFTWARSPLAGTNSTSKSVAQLQYFHHKESNVPTTMSTSSRKEQHKHLRFENTRYGFFTCMLIPSFLFLFPPTLQILNWVEVERSCIVLVSMCQFQPVLYFHCSPYISPVMLSQWIELSIGRHIPSESFSFSLIFSDSIHSIISIRSLYFPHSRFRIGDYDLIPSASSLLFYRPVWQSGVNYLGWSNWLNLLEYIPFSSVTECDPIKPHSSVEMYDFHTEHWIQPVRTRKQARFNLFENATRRRIESDVDFVANSSAHQKVLDFFLLENVWAKYFERSNIY